jgi:3-oxoacyl-[acyl-carrier-protein] synthase II
MRGFDALRSLTRERVRPFDRRRTGLLLGEGAALVMMAREGDVPAGLGRLLGHASAGDGTHVSAPDPEGRGLALAVRNAMAEAGISAAALDLVSAHGTATPLNDKVEAHVLRQVLGTRVSDVPVHAIKGGLGHTMGAAATLEAVACLLAARHGVIPHTFGLEEIDPECGLDVVAGTPRNTRPTVSLSTSLGFGGCNAALVLQGGPA